MEVINLTGMRFGRLAVIKRESNYISPKGYVKSTWLCKCDCGNEKIITAGNLQSGTSTSCGCYSKESLSSRFLTDLTGKKFGKLIVIKRIDDYISPGGNKVPKWLCKCSCGNETNVISDSLLKGSTKSCGCGIGKKSFGEATINRVYRNYKNNAKNRKIEFDIEKDFFINMTKQDCFYCGESPNNMAKSNCNNGDYIYNGIDRLDSSKGYIKTNVVTCCKQCNFSKNIMSKEEYISHCKKVVEHSKKE
jgi:hypothetical protein